ncbi:hypothetical protein [Schinkia azotoformans]|uniref:hypothetical protein n=1 Tax=Schinkia azotoformans TaxID=1454 RepID=UPI002DB8C356|nr:hypothetical protein [Schinkia azotoformans]MEC1720994.1 hypothetical protein [Schinkia azotoformans]MED4412245.1 hypothetical protein [Schinkia azotoformans]
MGKIISFHQKKEQFAKKLYVEVTHLIEDLYDSCQQTVGWLLYYSMKEDYPTDVVGFGIELWCNFCNEIDPIIDDERKYAASIELFVTRLLELEHSNSKFEILYKYGLHKIYDPRTIEI